MTSVGAGSDDSAGVGVGFPPHAAKNIAEHARRIVVFFMGIVPSLFLLRLIYVHKAFLFAK